MNRNFDRVAENIGNIVHLEHVNVTVPDQQLATIFYIMGMGFTRDPYIMPGITNMWINIGRSQCHLPRGNPQVLRGVIGVVVPDLDQLEERLAKVEKLLEGTRFSRLRKDRHMEVTCPWGNRFHAHAPAAEFGPTDLALPYVEFNVPQGTAEGIARFYSEVLHGPACVQESAGSKVAVAQVGHHQYLRYRETAAPIPDYDKHHLQIYIADFGGPHRYLKERGLITEESDQWQYRFVSIVDPKDGRKLFDIEHEVRSMTHPLYARPLVNRNPAQTNTAHTRGWDAFRGTF